MSKYDLKDKIAIVTGGGRGIGKGIALEYAKVGANVVVASRNKENLEEVAAEIKALGQESLVVVTDVTIPEQVDNLVKQTVDRFGRIDILVNNAGVGDTMRLSKLEELSPEAWRATIDLNLTGTFICSTAVGRVMIAQKKGKIVNISSVVGIYAQPILPHYSASKAAINSLTVSLAMGWAQYDINVNAIAPGSIVTERHHTNVKTVADDGTPIPRLQLPGSTEDVGHLAVFLASEASDHISGEIMGIMGLMRT
ncbi:MAG: SDR family NAD(P)-dependent oxidoreductase [Dehalococcoidia bacterium]